MNRRSRIPSGVRHLLSEAIQLAYLSNPTGDPDVDDVLDHLFTPARGDAEAVVLAGRLRPWIEELLAEFLPESGWEWDWERELEFGEPCLAAEELRGERG